MSGTSALGTLLVQRLDAVLGTQVASHASMIKGLGTNAVTRPGAPERVGIGGKADDESSAPTQATSGVAAPAQNRRAQQAAAQSALMLARNKREVRQDFTQSAPTSLGRAARTILSVLAMFPDGPPALSSDMPLWPSAPGGRPNETGTTAPRPTATNAATQPVAARFEEALHRVIGSSGIFYESHLLKLACGKKTREQLREQPQGKIAVSSEASGTDHARNSDRATVHADTGAMHSNAAALVRQQLDALAYQAISWRGEAWPGAEMDWELGHDADEASAHAPKAWNTRLLLTLPRLGVMEVCLTLTGNQVVMRIQAPASSDEIGESAGNLRARFDAAGLTLADLRVGR
jgi:hypothetical protein